jgi:hypothetical protein
VLEICGGELRKGDHAALGGGRDEMRDAGDRRKAGNTAAGPAETADGAPERRGFTS